MENVQPAPAPWSFEYSGKAGANGDFNAYILDKTGRKIAAVWGKRKEKEATAALLMAAPDLLAALKLQNHWGNQECFCSCPCKDATAPDERHSTACVDARQALRLVNKCAQPC